MKYVYSLLAIWHHQLKVKRKFNVNFNLNMKYDNARVKQKHLILISQHHWSPTTSHPPLLHPLPPTHSHLYAFYPCCFWKFKNIGKKRTIICITNTCFLRFIMSIASPHRGPQRPHLTENKKLRHSYNQFGLWVVSKQLEHDITYEILMNKIFLNWLQNLCQKSPFWNVKRAKNWHSELHVRTFPAFHTQHNLFFGLTH